MSEKKKEEYEIEKLVAEVHLFFQGKVDMLGHNSIKSLRAVTFKKLLEVVSCPIHKFHMEWGAPPPKKKKKNEILKGAGPGT